MNRKLDFPSLLLFTSLLFGTIVRFYPAIANGFPLNDGGMFYTMVQDLKSNGYALPQFTTYNHADIPFVYPPLGFYIASFLSLLPVSDLSIFLYLPALVNTISVFIFYLFAKETLNARIPASLATLIYALSPRAFLWQVMGGGITRAFGMLFLLLMLWQAMELFKNYQHKHLIFTILFGAGTVTSHPQTALHAVLGGLLIFLFYGFNKRGFISAILTGMGVAILSAPWWLTVFSRHGIEPFISAGQTSQRTLESYLSLIRFDGLGDYLILPTMLLAFIGIYLSLKRKDIFMLTWAVLALLIDPRGGEGIALLSFSMLASMGLIQLSAWINRTNNEPSESLVTSKSNLIMIFSLTIYFILGASIFDFQLVNTSLKANDLEMIEWVKSNVEDDKTFLLATGREFSMSDPMQEWFPALTNQYSATTMQGLEWTLGENFFPYYEQLQAFQKCADVNCVNEWAVTNNVDYDYLTVLIPNKNDSSELTDSLKNFGVSMRSSALHLLVYESEHALVFKLNK
ncbi:MAG: glycosyltransferase family 39 protein [Anaerolineales bacterium]|nr:glycosyltransferase family 39 protein [Anaerolineales bacterium]